MHFRFIIYSTQYCSSTSMGVSLCQCNIGLATKALEHMDRAASIQNSCHALCHAKEHTFQCHRNHVTMFCRGDDSGRQEGHLCRRDLYRPWQFDHISDRSLLQEYCEATQSYNLDVTPTASTRDLRLVRWHHAYCGRWPASPTLSWLYFRWWWWWLSSQNGNKSSLKHSAHQIGQKVQ